MAPTNVLSEKDANNSLKTQTGNGAVGKSDVKSMEYHRQVLKSKIEEEKYGRITNTNTNTTTTTTTVAAAPVSASSSSSTSGPGTATATVVHAAAAANPMMNKKTINNKPLTGLPADPHASGVCSATQQYISPSDGIMSPCTAKLNALKGRHAGKAKPKSLFAQASAKKFDSENVLGARNAAAQTALSTTTKAGNDVNKGPSPLGK